jgi:translation initiation factor IF-2
MSDRKKKSSGDGHEAREPVIENRKAWFDYTITDTLECGIKLGRFNDYQPGDVIECYELEKLEQSL